MQVAAGGVQPAPKPPAQPRLTHPIDAFDRSPAVKFRDLKLREHVTRTRAAVALVLVALLVAVAATPQLGGAAVLKALDALHGVSPSWLALAGARLRRLHRLLGRLVGMRARGRGRQLLAA